MKNTHELQTNGNILCPILNKSDAAKELGISVVSLNKMEAEGLILYNYLPGMVKPIYFRDRIQNVYSEYRNWIEENREKYQELLNDRHAS